MDAKYSHYTSDDGNICPGDIILLHSTGLEHKQHILGFIMGGDPDYDYLTSSRNAATQQRNTVDVMICIDSDPTALENNYLGMLTIGSVSS